MSYSLLSKNINQFVVLYGCVAWPVILREKLRLRMFLNVVLRMTLGPKMDDVTGERRRLYKESFMIFSPHRISLGDKFKKN